MKRSGVPVLSALVLLTGCGSQQLTCTRQGFLFVVGPDPFSNAAPDHRLAAPGNQQHFNAGVGSTYGPGCISNQLYLPMPGQWTTSDPARVSISSAQDATNGVATCLDTTTAGTTVSATVTSQGFTETQSAPIQCR